MKYQNFTIFSKEKFKSILTNREVIKNSRYGSFNLATHVGDNIESVFNNREILKEYFGKDKILIIPNQIHSNIVEIVTENSEEFNCDALITNKKEFILGVLVADCVPILIYDNIEKVFAVIHAGWRGSVGEICKNTIETMKSSFSCKVENLKVAIGPSILGECYEVGEEVYKNFHSLLKDDFSNACIVKNAKGYLDLQKVNEILLLRLGIQKSNIETVRVCTHCNTDKFYSYRKEGVTGRFGIFASLE